MLLRHCQTSTAAITSAGPREASSTVLFSLSVDTMATGTVKGQRNGRLVQQGGRETKPKALEPPPSVDIRMPLAEESSV